MKHDLKIFVAGHRGMVGSAIVRKLRQKGYSNLLLKTKDELDLTNQSAVKQFFESEKPEYVFAAAAKVGGIEANNTLRADFIYQNLMIEANIIHSAHLSGIQRMLFLGSNCIYPRDCEQPVREEFLLTGPLEQTNEPYAIAKIAGVKLCESYNRQYGRQYLTAMPVNLFGPGDNYQENISHVMPSLIRKVHDAKSNGLSSICLWGTGTPRREFMHCDDLADACTFLFELNDSHLTSLTGKHCPLINIGTGGDQEILSVARTVCRVLGFKGEITHDLSKPDGTPRKCLDTRLMDTLGWKPQIDLESGIIDAYQAFLSDKSRH